jgi:rod shape-determining protein MreC
MTNKYNKWIGIGFLLASVLLAALPLSGVVNSVKSVLSYVFIPQIRAAHSSQEYFKNAWDTAKELLDVHAENERLRGEVAQAVIAKARVNELLKENESLSQALTLAPQKKWEGVWAKVAYREPARWNTLIIDKGRKDGVLLKGAVLAVTAEGMALAGEIIEEEESTAKVLLINDAEFSALGSAGGVEGLIRGRGGNGGVLSFLYVPLETELEADTPIYTSRQSTIFPRGVLIGRIKAPEKTTGMNTSLSYEAAPAVNAAGLREVFVLKAGI